MNNDNNRYVWWVVGIIVIVLVIWGVFKLAGGNKTNQSTNNTNQQTANNPPPPPPPPAVISNNPSYNKAVVQYADKRIQFQQSCQTVPNNVVYKNGVTLMLDNRASITHTIKIDSKTYVIGAYDYTIVTLSNTKLPHTILVDCDKSQNVATIMLEK